MEATDARTCHIQFCMGTAESHVFLKDAALDVRFCYQHAFAIGQVPLGLTTRLLTPGELGVV